MITIFIRINFFNIKKLTVTKDIINKWLLFLLEYAFLLKQRETKQNQSSQCQC